METTKDAGITGADVSVTDPRPEAAAAVILTAATAGTAVSVQTMTTVDAEKTPGRIPVLIRDPLCLVRTRTATAAAMIPEIPEGAIAGATADIRNIFKI